MKSGHHIAAEESNQSSDKWSKWEDKFIAKDIDLVLDMDELGFITYDVSKEAKKSAKWLLPHTMHADIFYFFIFKYCILMSIDIDRVSLSCELIHEIHAIWTRTRIFRVLVFWWWIWSDESDVHILLGKGVDYSIPLFIMDIHIISPHILIAPQDEFLSFFSYSLYSVLPLCETKWVMDSESRTISDRLRKSSSRRRDDRKSVHLSLDNRTTKSLMERWTDETVGVLIPPCHLPGLKSCVRNVSISHTQILRKYLSYLILVSSCKVSTKPYHDILVWKISKQSEHRRYIFASLCGCDQKQYFFILDARYIDSLWRYSLGDMVNIKSIGDNRNRNFYLDFFYDISPCCLRYGHNLSHSPESSAKSNPSEYPENVTKPSMMRHVIRMMHYGDTHRSHPWSDWEEEALITPDFYMVSIRSPENPGEDKNPPKKSSKYTVLLRLMQKLDIVLFGDIWQIRFKISTHTRRVKGRFFGRDDNDFLH